jgi:hypothetical protein
MVIGCLKNATGCPAAYASHLTRGKGIVRVYIVTAVTHARLLDIYIPSGIARK